eukprot:6197993-Pleurochrysis_carterae.AAC.1
MQLQAASLHAEALLYMQRNSWANAQGRGPSQCSTFYSLESRSRRHVHANSRARLSPSRLPYSPPVDGPPS